MSNIYDFLKTQDRIANQIAKMSNPVIFNDSILQGINAWQSQLNSLASFSANYPELLAKQAEIFSRIPDVFNSNIYAKMNAIYSQLSSIPDFYNSEIESSDVELPNREELLSAITDFSDYVEDNSNIDTSEMKTTIINIYNYNSGSNNNISSQNWFAIITLIIYVLGLIIALFPYLKPINLPTNDSIVAPIITPAPELEPSINLTLEQIQLTLDTLGITLSDI